ncbi:NAD(P)H-binding protein [Spirillospora sp. NPDC052269]
MILVTGATGNVGREVVRALAAAGAGVRAMVRDRAPADLPADVQQVKADLNDPTTFGRAVDQAKGLFLLPGYDHTPELLAEAKAAGVEHVVLLSGSSAGLGDLTNAVTRYMSESEHLVRACGLAWTILRPSAFMSNTLQWVPQLSSGDVVRAPFAGVPVANIDPADIGAVAAAAFLEDGHRERLHRLTGPEPLLPADRLRILAEALGRDLRFEAQPDDEAHTEMSASMPSEYVDAFFDFYVKGSLDESEVNTTVEDVTGRPARTFTQWASAHTGAFGRL